ncbi:FG-GAP repeat domain-containing protein [Streptomyces sp. NPDC006477]|uniref:FG-GAP repeat domain-containing protein n=1 Tax=Streptomyces sp. NPDC006477 TaxID=3364747 RepID=UPI003679C24B
MTGRRLAAATLVLATVTGTLAATPAFAAPATGVAVTGTGAEQQDVLDLPAGATLLGSGPSGFLTSHEDRSSGKTVYRWTRYEDGSVTTLPTGTGTMAQSYSGGIRSDAVVGITGRVYTLLDMSSPDADPVVIDASHLGSASTFRLLAGSTVVTTSWSPTYDGEVHLLSSKDGQTVDKVVQGLPDHATPLRYDLAAPGTLVIHYRHAGDTGIRAAVVDIASGTVVEDRPPALGTSFGDITASATHLAWAEVPAFADDAALRVGRRGEEASERIPLGKGSPLAVEFLGDWVAYGVTDYRTTTAPNPLHALAARSLKDGRTVKLLDLVSDIRSDGDDAILVQGATVEHGEGLYRITAGPEGDPVVTRVANAGRPVVLELTGQSVPATVDLSKAAHPVLSWKFAATVNAVAQIELTHKASGKRWTMSTTMGDNGHVGALWNGGFDGGTAAQLGSYTWRMTARTAYDLGPAYERSGTLTVVGPHAPHGFTNSSSPDLLIKDGGSLTAYDGKQVVSKINPPVPEWRLGSGWDAYDQIVTPGNTGGAPNADVLGRDRSGVLWQHLGTGDVKNPFAPRTRVGTGWQAYRLLTGGSDLTGDGRPDLVGIDSAGVQWLHKGTGSWSKPFAARVRVGGGWGVYNLVTTTGNIAGGPAGDLVARDRNGVLWLHLGKGDGTFAPRTRIGGGWSQFSSIAAVGDADRDGRPDLVAKVRPGVEGSVLAWYRGTGQWATPFKYPVHFSAEDVPWTTDTVLH